MPRPIHDVAASTASSARSWLQSIDRSKVEVVVPTATLIMWLETLIGQTQAPAADDLKQAATLSVMGRFTAISTAAESQQEAWVKESEAEASAIAP